MLLQTIGSDYYDEEQSAEEVRLWKEAARLKQITMPYSREIGRPQKVKQVKTRECFRRKR